MKQYVYNKISTGVLWDDVKHPVGVVQIVYGLGENAQQYDRFAQFMNDNGFIVFVGNRNATDTVGDIFAQNVKDEIEILRFLKNKYELPVFLFGQNYGSFIIQQMMQQTKLCTASVCLSGAGLYPRWLLTLGQTIAWIGGRIWGTNARARLVNFFSPLHDFKTHEAPQYKTYGFYHSLFKHLINMNYDICPETPLLIISGGRDVTNMNGRLARALYNAYGENDLRNLTLIIYPNTRNKPLFDAEYESVQNDILGFFKDANIKR